MVCVDISKQQYLFEEHESKIHLSMEISLDVSEERMNNPALVTVPMNSSYNKSIFPCPFSQIIVCNHSIKLITFYWN